MISMGAAFVLGFWLVSMLLRLFSQRDTAAPGAAGQAPHMPGADVAQARWFEVLEVDEGATLEEISAAYKRRISQYHPDKVQQLGPELVALAEARARAINAAYDVAMRLRPRA